MLDHRKVLVGVSNGTWAREGFVVLVGSVALLEEAVGHAVGPGRGQGVLGPSARLPAPWARGPAPKLALVARLWLGYRAIAHQGPRLCEVVLPVWVPARRPQAQRPPRGLGKDDAGVVQVQGAMTSTTTTTATNNTPASTSTCDHPRSFRVPDGAQGELEAGGRGAGGGRGPLFICAKYVLSHDICTNLHIT